MKYWYEKHIEKLEAENKRLREALCGALAIVDIFDRDADKIVNDAVNEFRQFAVTALEGED